MAAEQMRPAGGRCDVPCAAPTTAPRSGAPNPVPSLAPGGEPMAARTRRTRGRIQAGPYAARRPTEREMRNSCKHPMEWRVGRRGSGALDVWRPWNASSRKTTRGRFRQIAQLPYATVSGPVRVGGARGRAGGGPTVCFQQIAQLPYATVGDRSGCVGSAVMPAEAARRIFDKSCSYPIQLSGSQCRRVHAGSGRSSASDRAGHSST